MDLTKQKIAPESKIIIPLDPEDFDWNKIKFSSVQIKNLDALEKKSVNFKYGDKDKLYVVARNCKILSVIQDIEFITLTLQIRDVNYIKMIKYYDIFLNFTGYENRKIWFNDTFQNNTFQNIKPTLSYNPICGYTISYITRIGYKNSTQFCEDNSLLEKNRSVDVCFSFNKINIQQNTFYCSNTIERIQKIKYIGPWFMNMHNETTKNFKNCIISILLCNNAMNNPLHNNILIYNILAFLQTF